MIADEKYRELAIGHNQWKSLIAGSSLQSHCLREGFNSASNSSKHAKVRIGVIANDQGHCDTSDSFVGFGAQGYPCQVTITTGNCAFPNADNGRTEIAAYGIILGQ